MHGGSRRGAYLLFVLLAVAGAMQVSLMLRSERLYVRLDSLSELLAKAVTASHIMAISSKT